MFGRTIHDNLRESTRDREKRRGRRTVGLIGVAFGSIFVLFGAFFMYSGISRGMAQSSTSDWLQTTGQVLSVTSQQGDPKSRQSPMSYKYEIDGRVYRSDRVVFVSTSNIEYGDWLALANAIPESGDIDVYYNPNEPAESVLITGSHEASWHGLGTGALFAGFAIVWMIAWWTMTGWIPSKFKRVAERNANEHE